MSRQIIAIGDCVNNQRTGDCVFKVYHSNQVDVLQALLVELIRREPLQNPFEKEHILVQSPGMSQWLNMAIAEQVGVAANIEFPLPATFIWDMFVNVLHQVPKRSAFNKESMTWKLIQLLPTMLEQPDFAPLRQYLTDDTDGSKCYQLCEKIADIYDGYLVYRPDWIVNWEEERPVPELDDEDNWQRALWQALYDHTENLGLPLFHRANLYDEFIDTLDHYQGTLKNVPKRLFVFGITSLPPRYLDALYALGQHIDVHLFFTNPCRYDWSEVKDRRYLARLAAKNRQRMERDEQGNFIQNTSELQLEEQLSLGNVGNSLLASMGKMGRDNLYLLTQLGAPDIDMFVENNRANALQHLQHDILDLSEHQDDTILDTSHHKQVIQPQDKSLSFHACHSPMREVEALHDYLLDLFNQDSQLKPRDIIVMVADINTYSPVIQAVFGNTPAARYVPYSISDRTADKENPIINAYIKLLDLPHSRCTASELLELLETPAIMAKFEVTEEEFTRATQWVEATGIRWGLDASTAADFDLPGSHKNSWQFGIERMLLGYAMSQSSGLYDSADGPLQPYNEAQGMAAELVGKLAQFLQTVSHYRKCLSESQTVNQWQALLVGLMEDFFLVDTDGEGLLTSMRTTVDNLQKQLNEAHYHEPLANGIVAQYMKDKLSTARVSQRFLAGQVNFCTLMPMRSIPFKVVCLLGMNDGQYPRTVPKDGFDLMNNRHRHGDRSRRDDDRYMFLEALMSAQSHLYLSYVGQSIQDNSLQAPSVLVSELMEYCHQNYCLAGDEGLSTDKSGKQLLTHLTRLHTMTPFSEGAFAHQQGSFATEWLPLVNGQSVDVNCFYQQPLSPYIDSLTEDYQLDLTELQRFWRLPVQYFFNRRLKVNFTDMEANIEDDEPFSLNGLENYHLKNALLQALIEDNDKQCSNNAEIESRIKAIFKAQGKLPTGAFADIAFDHAHTQVNELFDTLHPLLMDAESDVAIDLSFDFGSQQPPIKLSGWVNQVYHTGVVRFRAGRIRSQDYLSSWITHLAVNGMGLEKASHLLGYDKKNGPQQVTFPALAQHDAYLLLSDLVALYFKGMDQPIPYLPETCLACVNACIEGKEDNLTWQQQPEKSQQAMHNSFHDSGYGAYAVSGEGKNAYIQRVWPEWDDTLASQIEEVAIRVIETPLLQTKGLAANRSQSFTFGGGL